MTKTDRDPLRPFTAHGVVFTGTSGDQAIGTCPFSGKEGKFYVNVKNQLWDSKVAGLSGNLPTFLQLTGLRYVKDLTRPLLRKLAADRYLPEVVFDPWHLGWTGSSYSLPVRDYKGVTTDIRTYRLGGHFLSTPGGSAGLLGAEKLKLAPTVPVYVCEGEWDGMALTWLLKKLQIAGVVVAVPGAAVFKQEWVPWFSQRTVYALYDNDAAGEEGERVLLKRLQGTARSVHYLHWPDNLPLKFDVRDWIIEGAIKGGRPRDCWRVLSAMFRPEPRPLSHGQSTTVVTKADAEAPTVAPTKWKKGASLEDVFTVFKKWLFLENTDAIEIMLATILSNQIEGDPLWMFLVSPPGGAKTETLMSLSRCENTFMVSSLTPHALISGASWVNGVDPSLIPKLDGRVLVIKDFTSILSKRDQEKDEIFGILRDAYDGRCAKVFGTGITRSYQSRFGILAAVTPAIYEITAHHQSLGERFLKFLVGDNLVHHSESDIIMRSIQNINSEIAMRDELSDVVLALVQNASMKKVPEISEAYRNKLVALAQFGARSRGTVARHEYRPDIVVGRPMAEVGSRLGKQLAKLAISIALVNGRASVTEHEYRLVKKTMLDTIPQRNEDIIRTLFHLAPTEQDAIRTKTLSLESRYPLATVVRILADMHILDIVTRTGNSNSFRWMLSKYIREMITTAEIYKPRSK